MQQSVKYIIVKIDGIEVSIIFPELLEHYRMASIFREVIFAGFVQIYSKDNQVECCTYGKSTSLHLKSRIEDRAIINNILHKGGLQ
jgi:hypothetical protein